MVTINPQKITGKWKIGFALDLHTLSSTYLGVNESGHEVYDTKRPEVGELLYRLKYRADMAAADEIVKAASEFLAKRTSNFGLIIPVPPSGVRSVQPVITIAKGISKATGIPLVEAVTTTRAATQLKGVMDPEERKKLVDGLYAVDVKCTSGKDVLLFDDVFRSGTTMNAITELLLGRGKASSVRALTITRTRRNQ